MRNSELRSARRCTLTPTHMLSLAFYSNALAILPSAHTFLHLPAHTALPLSVHTPLLKPHYPRLFTPHYPCLFISHHSCLFTRIQEKARIAKLVELAYSHDPRVKVSSSSF